MTSTSPQVSSSARERAQKILTPYLGSHQQLSGFVVERSETIDELDCEAYVMRHTASGARLLYLACEDDNKAFAIGFKTPPTDNTGVFHILEHSVLCGSAKYPVKEPFVELIKSSMQTFLNAMTYPDKTVYPVASTNEQDLLNLMDVYMDAVLNPAIYTKPAIFEQEGWHLELDVPEGAALTDPETHLRYNGVVYNEMKGALSDPLSVLDDAINKELFPDTAYAYQSGGDPRAIPELTYQAFLDNHARHYNLANSYITLYGNLDIVATLAHLEERFLNDQVRARDAEARRAAAPDAQQLERALAAGPNPLEIQEPISCEYRKIQMQTSPENATLGLAYVLGGNGVLDRKRITAAEVLVSALFDSNESPIKKLLMSEGLGSNVSAYTQSACLQPYVLITVQGARPDAAQQLRELVEREAARLVTEGIPRERLEAILANSEFNLRQRDYGTADGVVLACEALSTWLYDDNAATLALSYAPLFEELRAELDTNYFEELLRSLVLENTHRALVELVPTNEALDDPSEAQLQQLRTELDEASLKEIAHQVDSLREIQEAEDTLEAMATLPRLHVSDIGDPAAEPALVVDTSTPLTCLKHDIPTRKLAYMAAYFDLSHVSFIELSYASILARLMKQLATKHHSASELDSYITSQLGFLSFSVQIFSQPDWRLARPVLKVSAGALSEKLDALVDIPREVWAETLFEDTDRIRDVLGQMKYGLEQSFLNAGHQAALDRAMSYVSPPALAGQQVSGIDFYRFISELLANFDERVDELVERMENLQARIFTSTNLVMSFTGSDEDYRRFWEKAGNLGLEPRKHPEKEMMVRWPEPRAEAFIIPSDVCYAARATDPRIPNLKLTGAWSVASRVLSFDYLWNEIRVKGGAYGCGFRAAKDRQLAFYTYRDPAVDASQARIDAAGSWLANFEADPETFEGYIVSCTASLDAPLSAYALAARQDEEFFSKRRAGWREELRQEILSTTQDDVRALGLVIEEATRQAPLCVFGGREIVEQSTLNLNVVELLG
ncbi:insulinase family protein [Collinsella sp. zg1085]|uniref:insulinase family protein n=1 Tax=Collinsella sp. zg1085 TaxID=2844380 RepID=UPI001C0C728E|nr:insulinase family protein [Collinsella sp. zg1085]QWT17742.1 insulinase family protein [Collinsella sp. zg1085]